MEAIIKSITLSILVFGSSTVTADEVLTPEKLVDDVQTMANVKPFLPAVSQGSIVLSNQSDLIEFPKIFCHPQAVHSIVMESNAIKKIPECISNHSLTLRELNLTKNEIDSIDGKIGKLSLLEKLTLTNNKLKLLPPQIGDLTSLTTLNLQNNHLTEIPRELGKLSNLTFLDLSNNDLSSLPFELSKLTRLEELVLSDTDSNKLLTAPEFLPYLINLTKLTIKSTPPLPESQKAAIRAVFKGKPLVKLNF